MSIVPTKIKPPQDVILDVSKMLICLRELVRLLPAESITRKELESNTASSGTAFGEIIGRIAEGVKDAGIKSEFLSRTLKAKTRADVGIPESIKDEECVIKGSKDLSSAIGEIKIAEAVKNLGSQLGKLRSIGEQDKVQIRELASDAMRYYLAAIEFSNYAPAIRKEFEKRGR